MLIIDDCDEAILGVVERCSSPRVVCYSYEKLLEVFIKQGMTLEEASEWISFNILGAWLGEETPYILFQMTREEIDEEVSEE